MRVGIDITQLHSLNKTRGIGFYSENLIDSLKRYTNIDVVVIENKAQREKCDIIHFPYFDLFRPTLPLIKDKPTVITIHDVIPLIFPQHYPPGIKGSLKHLYQKIALKNAQAIITNSNISKEGIVKHLKVPATKVFPTYLAPGEKYQVLSDKKILSDLKEKYNLPSNFALFTGNVNWNKNILGLTKACIDAEIDLFLVGSSFEKKDHLDHTELKSYKEFLEKYSRNPKIHILGFVETEDLVGLYNLATVLMLPSFYEGFGLTILEAQSCGTPVITSNNSSMKELFSDSALLVDPYDISEIAKGIEKIVTDQIFAQQLRKKGLENAKKFNWEKLAKETVKVYEKVLKV